MGSSTSQGDIDYSFKVLMIGDSGVGKSSLLLRFTSDTHNNISLTIGVDFKEKLMTVGGKRLKLTIWDTVYDVTRLETLTKLSDVWLEEVDVYSTNQDCIKMLIGNKVDMESERVVSKEEGIEFARQHGCSFHECSAKTSVNVEKCFEELVLKILETPSLLEESSSGSKKNIFDQEQPKVTPNDSCC